MYNLLRTQKPPLGFGGFCKTRNNRMTLSLPQYTTKLKIPQQENLLFTLPHSGAMYLWHNGRLWISVSRIWHALGTLCQALALSACGTVLILDDADGLAYVALDEFVKIMPPDVQQNLNVMKRRLMKNVKKILGGKK